MLIGRILTIMALAAGAVALLLADMFSTLAALSAGMAARGSAALAFGAAAIALGLVLTLFTLGRRRLTSRRRAEDLDRFHSTGGLPGGALPGRAGRGRRSGWLAFGRPRVQYPGCSRLQPPGPQPVPPRTNRVAVPPR